MSRAPRVPSVPVGGGLLGRMHEERVHVDEPHIGLRRPILDDRWRIDSKDMASENLLINQQLRRRKGRIMTTNYDHFMPRSSLFTTIAILTLLLVSRTSAAFINFQNCMPANIIHSNPRRLQFVPLLVNATYLRISGGYHLNVSISGNVTGQSTVGTYPAPDSATWKDPTNTFGKIVDVGPTTNIWTTMFAKYNLLTYTPYSMSVGEPLCQEILANTHCPIGPAFYADPSNPADLPGFSAGHTFGSRYSFGTLAATIRVQSGDGNAALACVSANITPDLGTRLSGLLTYLPVAILIFVAFATIFAAMFSPWGSLDPFRWSSNYGRDSDLLRLVTPGFGDCLQYIQFIILSGSLTLQYPGFFQPVVSQVSWSALMFNQSFVSHGPGTQSLMDGIYVTNSTYGLGSMSQLVGMSGLYDVWAGMVIWLIVVIVFTIALCQFAFLISFVFRIIINNAKEDLRSKNLPFSGGMLVRVVCNFFLLPIVSLTMFQLVLGSSSPAYVTAMAVVLLVALLAFAAWILRLIFTTEPRSTLFDDLPKVLLYGPLYNTYSDDAAPFALIPALLTFIRGIAIGAVQPSGIAQLVILAICEVVLILTLHAFRPFHSPTSMNAYHTFFACARLAVVLLMVAFVSTMGVTEGIKGWIGYAILLLHGIVLVFGFFLNALQRIIEVAARLAGAGGEEGTGAAARGGLAVLGVRQLSRRRKRAPYVDSLRSDALVLTDDADMKSGQYGGNRSRAQSANSAVLLNKQQSRTYSRLSNPLDQTITPDQDAETPYEQRTFSFLSGPLRRPDLGPTDPYFRAPRPRRLTGDLNTPGAKSRSSWITGDWANRVAAAGGESADIADKRDSTSWPMAPLSPQGPAPYRSPDEMEAAVNDPRHANVDYAVRESDFYYGVRGPALSSQATRKLKTGPADPVGPASSASGWFKGIFSRKNKESGKGFEVVRSSRMPLQQFHDGELSPQKYTEQYHDSPQSHTEAYRPGQQTRSAHEEQTAEQAVAGTDEPSPIHTDDEEDRLSAIERDAFGLGRGRLPDMAPSLGKLDLGGEIKLPSRFNSRVSHRVPSNASGDHRFVPAVPRRSSRRMSNSPDASVSTRPPPRLSTAYESHRSSVVSPPPPRLPFTSPTSPEWSRLSAAESIQYNMEGYEDPAHVLAEYTAYNEGDAYEGHPRSYHWPRTSDATSTLAPPSTGHNDRPVSTGFVNHFRAGESMRAGVGNSIHAGSSAEVVEEPTATSVRRRSEGAALDGVRVQADYEGRAYDH